ncbi:hypothetical protein NM688_g2714 [Phlebia brevispora]|uniref:Uncharacterized protein n=1 Tax=Phlebia brevispora TaxID=194682 RepID=A0ACC1T7Y5_9APHY|nr:hypothetical protein NM688_g2714 [Phlebia brevispora]
MPTTPANLPVELFKPILSFYTPSQCKLNEAGIHKRTLSAVALVCRTWALTCQPKIFEEIVLRNAKDVYRLWELMSHPLSRIGGYVKTIEYVVTNENCRVPWIDIACRKLKRCPKLSSSVRFHLYAGRVTARRLATAVSSPMSRCHRVTCIDRLELGLVKFAWLQDLGRVVRELSCLTKVELYGIVWEEPKEGGELPALLPCLSPGNLPTCVYKMRWCTDDRMALWLACMCSLVRTCQLRIEDVRALYWITRSLSVPWTFPIEAWSEKDAIHVDAHEWKLEAALTTSTGTAQQSIYSLQLHIARTSAKDWKTIEAPVMSLRDLREVCFHFDHSDDMRTFATREIPLDMPRLWSSYKHQLTLCTAEGGDKHTVYHTNAVRQETEDWLENQANRCQWTSEQTARLTSAFRERDLGVYRPMIRKLGKALYPDAYLESDDEQDQGSDASDEESEIAERRLRGDTTEEKRKGKSGIEPKPEAREETAEFKSRTEDVGQRLEPRGSERAKQAREGPETLGESR